MEVCVCHMNKNTKRVFERSILSNIDHLHVRSQENLAMVEKFVGKEDTTDIVWFDSSVVDSLRHITARLEDLHGTIMLKVTAENEKKRKKEAEEAKK